MRRLLPPTARPPPQSSRKTVTDQARGVSMRSGLAVFVVVAIGLASGSLHARQEPAASLDYNYFKTQVQPVFLKKREGHARCISCHGSGTPMRLQPLPAGTTSWTDE